MWLALLGLIQKVSANAGDNCAVGEGFDPNCPPNIGTIFGGPLAQTIQNSLFGLGPVLFVVSIVYAGYIRLTAADNPQKVKQANFTIMWAVVGYAVVLFSFLIIKLAASLLGVDVNDSVGVDL